MTDVTSPLSPSTHLYRALGAVAADNETAVLRPGLAHGSYTSAEEMRREGTQIFARSWVCVGHVADIAAPGDFTVESILDTGVLIARRDDGEVHAFHNRCRHRGHPVAEGRGSTLRFTCPYHAWTYSLDGALLRAPHTQGVDGVDLDQLGLRPIRVEIVAGAIFVNLDDEAPSFDECHPGLRAEIESWAPAGDDMTNVFESPTVHRANWKASVENFSECYHCGPVHRYLADNIIDPNSYEVTANRLVQRHVVGSRDGTMTQRLWHIWPNTAMGLYPIPDVGLVWCVRHMHPRSVDETTYHYRWYAAGDQDPDAIRAYAEHHAATTGAEDAAIVEGAQRGMAADPMVTNTLVCNPSRGVGSEHVIHYFHDLVRTAMETS